MNTTMIKAIIGLLSTFYTIFLPAQEQLGLRFDNYGGINTIVNNPAFSATQQLSWDVNLLETGFWFQNNYGYIQKATVPKTLKNANALGPHPSLGFKSTGNPVLLYNVTERSQYFATVGSRTLGPSVLLNFTNGHSIGFFTGLRVHLGSHNLPKILSPREMNQYNFKESFKVDGFKICGMAWSEFGLNYGYALTQNTEGGLTLGVNLKYLQGFQTLYINGVGGSAFTQVSKDTFKVDLLKADIAYTKSFDTEPLTPSGNGFGIDIGAVLTTTIDDKRPYLWRFSAALTDLGGISFKKNISANVFNITESVQFESKDFDSSATASVLVENLLNKATVKSEFRTIGNSLYMALPSSLNAQADYAFSEKWFLNGYVVLPFSLRKQVLHKDYLLAITPRYESRWLGASLPISLINGKQMRIGLSARLAFLTLGTDHLFSFIMPSKLYGTDFYIALKFNPFQLNLFDKSSNGTKPIVRKKARCYKF